MTRNATVLLTLVVLAALLMLAGVVGVALHGTVAAIDHLFAGGAQ